MLLSLINNASFLPSGFFRVGGLVLSLLVAILIVVAVVAQRNFRAWRYPPNLKRIGLVGRSNLVDQFDSSYTKSEGDENQEPIRIKALYIHPIKSCQPIEVTRARLTKIGFAYDRSFAFATSRDNGEWDFISQRTKPKMSLVQQELWLPDQSTINEGITTDPMVNAGGCLIVSFPDPDHISFAKRMKIWLHTGWLNHTPCVTFRVPLLPERTGDFEMGFPMRSFKMHRRMARGIDYGEIPEIASALPKLKRFLKVPARQELMLLRCSDETLTRADTNLAPLQHIGKPAMIGYVDQQPVHIVTLSSVHAVSTLLPIENQPLDARRFRANIYLTGSSAYAEETWKRYRIRRLAVASEDEKQLVEPTLSVVCRTARCTMPNVIPEQGVFDEQKPAEGRTKGKAQPSTTLVEHRLVEDTNPAALGYLGMHCVPEDSALEEARSLGSETWVRVGDEIEVLETGTHVFGSTGHDY